MGTNQPIPTKKFNPENPDINITPVEQYFQQEIARTKKTENRKYLEQEYTKIKKTLAKLFKTKYHYYLGSSTHCGCNFKYITAQGSYINGKTTYPEPQELRKLRKQVGKDIPQKKKLRDMENLFNYIHQIPEEIHYIEIYGTWDGEHNYLPILTSEYKLNEINPKTFVFIEGEFLKIIRNS